jgi:SAM-dependent methyltransferase
VTGVWLPRFACPECRAAVDNDEDDENGVRLACRGCGAGFGRDGGVYRFLSSERAEAAEPFLRQYRTVRGREGYRPATPEYYRMLPCVAGDDPHAGQWRVRRESYVHLQRHALPAVWQRPVHALDLGAGSGWLSHRLAALGHRVVAVDRLDDEADGLGACRHYPVPIVAVHADFDALPFEPSQFDLVVFDGSLHYSPDPAATLAGATRMLASDGAIAVMDSPMFACEGDGHAMVADELRRIGAAHGLSSVLRPGVGFLTFAALERAASSHGLRSRFFPSRGPIRWRVRRQLARLRLQRAPAAFGTWVAQ